MTEPNPATAADPLDVLAYAPAHELLDTFVLGTRRGEAIEHLAPYFTTDLYTGRRFERLEGGGDQPEVANRLTGADLAAGGRQVGQGRRGG